MLYTCLVEKTRKLESHLEGGLSQGAINNKFSHDGMIKAQYIGSGKPYFDAPIKKEEYVKGHNKEPNHCKGGIKVGCRVQNNDEKQASLPLHQNFFVADVPTRLKPMIYPNKKNHIDLNPR